MHQTLSQVDIIKQLVTPLFEVGSAFALMVQVQRFREGLEDGPARVQRLPGVLEDELYFFPIREKGTRGEWRNLIAEQSQGTFKDWQQLDHRFGERAFAGATFADEGEGGFPLEGKTGCFHHLGPDVPIGIRVGEGDLPAFKCRRFDNRRLSGQVLHGGIGPEVTGLGVLMSGYGMIPFLDGACG
jgi:hypothetical protein